MQYFNNEQYEAERYDRSLKKYEDASLKTSTSLAFLNFGQNAIFSTAISAAMLLSAHQIAEGQQQVITCRLHILKHHLGVHRGSDSEVPNLQGSIPKINMDSLFRICEKWNQNDKFKGYLKNTFKITLEICICLFVIVFLIYFVLCHNINLFTFILLY